MHTEVLVLEHDARSLREGLGSKERLLRILCHRRESLADLVFLTVVGHRETVRRTHVDARIALDAQVGREVGLNIAVAEIG